MADAVYAIEDFPDDDLLWRIEWIGGVGYNTSVPSDPQIEICLAQLPAGETNTLAHFPGNDGVQTDVVDYDESPGTPANETGKNLGVRRRYPPVLNDARYTGPVAR